MSGSGSACPQLATGCQDYHCPAPHPRIWDLFHLCLAAHAGIRALYHVCLAPHARIGALGPCTAPIQPCVPGLGHMTPFASNLACRVTACKAPNGPMRRPVGQMPGHQEPDLAHRPGVEHPWCIFIATRAKIFSCPLPHCFSSVHCLDPFLSQQSSTGPHLTRC